MGNNIYLIIFINFNMYTTLIHLILSSRSDSATSFNTLRVFKILAALRLMSPIAVALMLSAAFLVLYGCHHSLDGRPCFVSCRKDLVGRQQESKVAAVSQFDRIDVADSWDAFRPISRGACRFVYNEAKYINVDI